MLRQIREAFAEYVLSKEETPWGAPNLQLVLKFPNGFGASIVNSYDEWVEIAITKFTEAGWDWDFAFDNPLELDGYTVGVNTMAWATEVLNEIKDIPADWVKP